MSPLSRLKANFTVVNVQGLRMGFSFVAVDLDYVLQNLAMEHSTYKSGRLLSKYYGVVLLVVPDQSARQPVPISFFGDKFFQAPWSVLKSSIYIFLRRAQGFASMLYPDFHNETAEEAVKSAFST